MGTLVGANDEQSCIPEGLLTCNLATPAHVFAWILDSDSDLFGVSGQFPLTFIFYTIFGAREGFRWIDIAIAIILGLGFFRGAHGLLAPTGKLCSCSCRACVQAAGREGNRSAMSKPDLQEKMCPSLMIAWPTLQGAGVVPVGLLL